MYIFMMIICMQCTFENIISTYDLFRQICIEPLRNMLMFHCRERKKEREREIDREIDRETDRERDR